MTERKLRVLHILVQPVLVWDDGQELTPAPTVDARSMTLTELNTAADQIGAEIPEMERHLLNPDIGA